MTRFFASETLTVAVLVVLFAGDFVRNALTVPGWIAVALLSALWAIGRLAQGGFNWRTIPASLIALLGWVAVSPLWSPYALSSTLLSVGFILTVVTAIALAYGEPLAKFVSRSATTLRIVLVGSLLFEFAVALSGTPLFPVGLSVTDSTSIELAWSRGLLFDPQGRIQGIVGNANLLGMLALVSLVFALVRLTRQPRALDGYADALLAAVVQLRTGSSTVLLALVAVALVWALAWLVRRNSTPARWAIGAIVALALASGVVALTNWTAVTALLGKSADLTHRFDIWNAVIERISAQPLVGHGFVGWWPNWEPWFAIHSIRGIAVSQAHNLWLDLAMQLGFIGVALFVAVLARVAWLWWRPATHPVPTPESLAAVAIVVALLVQSITESRMLSEWGIAIVVVLLMTGTRREIASATP